MAQIEWSDSDDLEQEWQFRYALIEALREIAEQIKNLDEHLTSK